MARVTIVIEDVPEIGGKAVHLDVSFDPPPPRPATADNLTPAQILGANVAAVGIEMMEESGSQVLEFGGDSGDGSGKSN